MHTEPWGDRTVAFLACVVTPLNSAALMFDVLKESDWDSLHISRGGTAKMGRRLPRLELARGHGFCWHERRESQGWMEADDLLGWTLMGTTNGGKMILKCSHHPLSPFRQLLTAPSMTLWHLAWKTVDVVAGALSWTTSGSVVQSEQLERSNLPLRKTYCHHYIAIVMKYGYLMKVVNRLPLWSQTELSSFLPSRIHGRSDIAKYWYSWLCRLQHDVTKATTSVFIKVYKCEHWYGGSPYPTQATSR